MIKHRLYRYLRHKFSKDWVSALDQVTKDTNFTENIGINHLVPAKVNTPLDDPIVRKAREIAISKRKQLYPQKDFVESKKNQTKKDNYKVGDFVYWDDKTIPFMKSFDTSRGKTYLISKINKTYSPYLYTLRNLKKQNGDDGSLLPDKVYASSLRPALNPYKNKTPVDYIVDEKINEKGRKLYLVKYLFYDEPEWVTSADFVKKQ